MSAHALWSYKVWNKAATQLSHKRQVHEIIIAASVLDSYKDGGGV